MIKKKSEKSIRTEVDLTGPEGNLYVLLGYAKQWAEQLGLDYKKIIAEMKSGDYENLVAVMEREFGEFVIFYR